MDNKEAEALQAQLDRLNNAVINRNEPEIQMVTRKPNLQGDAIFGGKDDGTGGG